MSQEDAARVLAEGRDDVSDLADSMSPDVVQIGERLTDVPQPLIKSVVSVLTSVTKGNPFARAARESWPQLFDALDEVARGAQKAQEA